MIAEFYGLCALHVETHMKPRKKEIGTLYAEQMENVHSVLLLMILAENLERLH